MLHLVRAFKGRPPLNFGHNSRFQAVGLPLEIAKLPGRVRSRNPEEERPNG